MVRHIYLNYLYFKSLNTSIELAFTVYVQCTQVNLVKFDEPNNLIMWVST